MSNYATCTQRIADPPSCDSMLPKSHETALIALFTLNMNSQFFLGKVVYIPATTLSE